MVQFWEKICQNKGYFKAERYSSITRVLTKTSSTRKDFQILARYSLDYNFGYSYSLDTRIFATRYITNKHNDYGQNSPKMHENFLN